MSVDEGYERFLATLPQSLYPVARDLQSQLQLAPPGVPWSRVFSHSVTLGAPELVAEALEHVAPRSVALATTAHALAVIEAFGVDRIADRQVDATSELEGVLEAARAARDGALRELAGGAMSDPISDFTLAAHQTHVAIAAEHELLTCNVRVPWRAYVAVSLGKQRLGIPASALLVRHAGIVGALRANVTKMLEGVWLGLQLHDDVVDWVDDFRRGGAWAVALATDDRPASLVSARDAVFASGVLVRMLRGSARFYRSAHRRAQLLGARSLEAWATERERVVAALAEDEQRSPGYVERAHAMSQWAKVVL